MRKTGKGKINSRTGAGSAEDQIFAAATARVKSAGRCSTTGVAGTRKRGKNEGQEQATRNRDEPDDRPMRIGMRSGGSRDSQHSLQGEQS
jgi:hypothetical protein